MALKFHSLRISEIRRETEDTVSIAFEIPSELRADYTFLSGQYLTIKAKIDNEELRRSYSLCSAPHEDEWRIAIKQVPNGKFSTFANKELKPGASLDIMTPTGNFILQPNKTNSKSYVLFAAGSGITPVLSILKTVLKSEPNSNVTLFFGNKGFASIIFREEIEGLKNQYMDRLRIVHILSREGLENSMQHGRIDNAKVEKLYDAFLAGTSIDAVYICGPESMILGVKESMVAKGVDEAKIYYELFTTPSTQKTDIQNSEAIEKIESNVTVIMDGDSVDLHLKSTGKSVLEAAHDAGADLPYACKGGVCCTCKARIIEGSVIMDVNYSLTQEEINKGFILTCQSHPTSDKLIVSFDE